MAIQQARERMFQQTIFLMSQNFMRAIKQRKKEKEDEEEIKTTTEKKIKEGHLSVRFTRTTGLYFYISLRTMGQRKTKKRNMEGSC